MQLKQQFQNIVEQQIAELNLPNAPKQLYEPITYTMEQKGKRIRPVFTLLACSMFSDDVSSAVKTAVGMEVFHNFTLLHDDIMDNADIRRGQPTVHKKWNANTAILSGDTMLIEAYKLISSAPTNVLKPVLDTFSQTAVEVCEGQMYDMDFETQQNVSIDEYLEMIRLKTSVLIAGALKIGAIIGGADQEDTDNIYQFGVNLGIAFQLIDDYLDAYSDPKVFGKQTGGDIIENKKTYLLISAMNNANTEQKEQLNYWINKTDFDEKEKISSVKNIYNELNIKELTLQKAKEYSEKALEFLDKVKSEKEGKEVLRQIGIQLLEREY